MTLFNYCFGICVTGNLIQIKTGCRSVFGSKNIFTYENLFQIFCQNTKKKKKKKSRNSVIMDEPNLIRSKQKNLIE